MFRNRLIGVVAAICALVAVTAAIAQGSGTAKSSSAKSKGTTAHGAQASGAQGLPGTIGGPDGDMHGPGGGAVHSVGVVPDKAGTSFITLTTDRGTVKSVDSAGATITIDEGTKSATYKTLTLTVPSGAKVIRDGKTASLGEIKAEDDVSVSSSSEGTTVFAIDSSFRPEHGPGRGGPPGMAGPPPGQEASGAEAKSGTGTKTGTGTTTTTE
jgi:type IV secretory pathway TrbL component